MAAALFSHSCVYSADHRPSTFGRGRHRHGAHNSREGGEQGDPFMPLLFSVGHSSLEAVGAQLRRGKHLLAFLDDIHMVT